MLVAVTNCIGCALGSAPQLHHPNAPGSFDGYVGYSLPIQPATARLRIPNPGKPESVFATEIKTSSGAVVPDLPVAYLADPQLYGSYGLTEKVTLVAGVSWSRQSLSLDYFTATAGRGGFKVALGAIGGAISHEASGWCEGGWLPVLSRSASGYVGLGISAGDFRHFFTLPNIKSDLILDNGDPHLPTTQPYLELLRTEVRLRTSLGAEIWLRRGSFALDLGIHPYLTVLHGQAQVGRCNECPVRLTIEDFRQEAGVELQAGLRF